MIERTLTVTVSNNTSSLNEKLVFYARDRGILIHFIIKDVKYIFSNSSILGSLEPPLRAEIYALKPDGKSVIRFDSVTISNNTVDFMLTESLTDQTDEIGFYTLQIIIYSDNDNARLAIPPFQFEVKETLVDQNAVAGVSTLNNGDYKLLGGSEYNREEIENLFDENGVLIPDTLLFQEGEVITSEKLNNIVYAMQYLSELINKE